MNDRDVLNAERLSNRLRDLRSDLRARYRYGRSPVVSREVRDDANGIAKSWLVDVEPELRTVREIKPDELANRSVAFQRLASYAEHASQRQLYERHIDAILRSYQTAIIFPAKGALRSRSRPLPQGATFAATAFVGHSFDPADKEIVSCVVRTFGSLGIHTETGERPAADSVPEKVKRRIDAQHMFVGVFTRREKIARRKAWTTSQWVIDEKTYAFAKGKRLILLREEGVDSIGGIQGNHEYVTFVRAQLHELVMAIVSLFDVSTTAFRS